MSNVVDPFYLARAKDVTNMLFDKRFLADDLSRESVDKLESFLGYCFQSQAESAVKCAELKARFRDGMRQAAKHESEIGE